MPRKNTFGRRKRVNTGFALTKSKVSQSASESFCASEIPEVEAQQTETSGIGTLVVPEPEESLEDQPGPSSSSHVS